MIKILTVGNACVDFVHTVPDHLTPKLKIDSYTSNVQLGGSAANVAVALKALGADVTVCTILGNKSGLITKIFCDLLKQKQIELICEHVQSSDTANSLITVLPDGNRSIAHHAADDIINSKNVDVDVSQYDMILADTYRLPLVNKIFDLAKKASIPTMLDVDKPISKIDNMPVATQVWFSQEAWQNFDNLDYLENLQQIENSLIGVTDGENPVIWLEPTSSVFQSYKPKSVSVVNSLGAGDVFRASLALQLCMNIPLTVAIERACESAGEHISGKTLTKII